MIAVVQTNNGNSTSRQSKSPGEYDHFRRILKTRQKFPSSADCQMRKSRPSTLNRKSPLTAPCKRPFNFFQERPKTQSDIQDKPEEFYSLFNLPYKNYKYQKPPGQINVAEYLEGTYKIGKIIGKWDKNMLHNKLNINNLQLKRSNYTCDHLIKARKPQGPSSCLETIYIAKIQLEDNQSEEAQIKIKALEDTLKQDITQMQIKLPSQSYILNRWTRQPIGQELNYCHKNEIVPKFSFQKNTINQSVESLKKSIIHLKSFENSSQISELPQQMQFLKFDPKQNSLRHLYKLKGMTIQLFKEGFAMLQKPIIGDRIILSFDLCPTNLEQRIPYTTFQAFLQVYVQKKARLKQTIDTVLNFYDPEKTNQITNQEFLNLNRVLCDQFVQKHNQVQPIYEELIQNFKISKVISNNQNEYFDQIAFKHLFISNQMNIQDLIDLISDE